MKMKKQLTEFGRGSLKSLREGLSYEEEEGRDTMAMETRKNSVSIPLKVTEISNSRNDLLIYYMRYKKYISYITIFYLFYIFYIFTYI